jgi:predicted KAP-like P-loop ATPase
VWISIYQPELNSRVLYLDELSSVIMIEIIQRHHSIMDGEIGSLSSLMSENMLSYSLISHQILAVKWDLSWQSESDSALLVQQMKMEGGLSTSIYNQ